MISLLIVSLPCAFTENNPEYIFVELSFKYPKSKRHNTQSCYNLYLYRHYHGHEILLHLLLRGGAGRDDAGAPAGAAPGGDQQGAGQQQHGRRGEVRLQGVRGPVQGDGHEEPHQEGARDEDHGVQVQVQPAPLRPGGARAAPLRPLRRAPAAGQRLHRAASQDRAPQRHPRKLQRAVHDTYGKILKTSKTES